MGGSSDIITVSNVVAGYPGVRVLENVNFSVRRGEVFALLGGSGCGKSTIMKHLIGLNPVLEGTLVVDGLEMNAANRDRILRRIGVMYQSGALFGSMSVLENVMLPLEEFTKHVLVNRTVESIHDVECAKQYFYRYATNPVAGAMLRRALEEQERDQRATSTFCHEDADSAPGHRSYHGIPLPDDAPPRPDQQSEWDFESHSWVSCRA